MAEITPESKFLARARAQMAARNAKHPLAAERWAGLAEDERESELKSRARAYAVHTAPVGQTAARVYDAVCELHGAFKAFLRSYPDDATIAAAAGAAITDAGLDLPTRWTHRGADCFAGTPAEVAGWSHMVEVMLGMFEDLARPEDDEEVSEGEVSSAVTAGAA